MRVRKIELLAVMGGALVAAITLHPRDAEACSGCIPAQLVPGDGATVPANLPAITWRPSSSGALTDPAALTLTRDDAPDSPLALTATRNDDGTYSLVADPPLVAGHTYTMRDASACEPFTGTGDSGEWSFTVVAEAPLPTSLGAISAGARERKLADLATSDGSCQRSLDIAQVAIDIAYAPEALPWKDVLFFRTFVDGQWWLPYEHALMPPPPGGNWRGRGDDWIFTVCEDDVEPIISEGPHEVEIRATLRGTSMVLSTGTINVSLACEGPPPGDDLHGGGCSTSRPTPATGVAAALALALAGLLRRRRARPAAG